MNFHELIAEIDLRGLYVNNLFQQQMLRGDKPEALNGRRWASNLRSAYSDKPTTWFAMGYGDTPEEALQAAWENFLKDPKGGSTCFDRMPHFIEKAQLPKPKISVDDLL